MPDTPLADRVTILEAKMQKIDLFIASFDRALEVRFRAQAEMLDERFAGVDQRFDGVDQRFDGIDERFTRVERSLDAMRRDITILREGMKILLERVR